MSSSSLWQEIFILHFEVRKHLSDKGQTLINVIALQIAGTIYLLTNTDSGNSFDSELVQVLCLMSLALIFSAAILTFLGFQADKIFVPGDPTAIYQHKTSLKNGFPEIWQDHFSAYIEENFVKSSELISEQNKKMSYLFRRARLLTSISLLITVLSFFIFASTLIDWCILTNDNCPPTPARPAIGLDAGANSSQQAVPKGPPVVVVP
ncbi:hypothetical protein [Rhizobium sp. SL42]|uniref:hypothetical protein n=1 Tax=Rhizobium sp. SL42 TaxID=2806346 RepID=UPI001F332F2F|nr:hypothetical protein [Rhizobium sp. SL42]UJW76662.1 hypothetical protein IM739_09455 [Rhizobium sp. SL42]